MAASGFTAIPVTPLLIFTINQRCLVKLRHLMQLRHSLVTHQAWRSQRTINMVTHMRTDTVRETLPEIMIHHIHRQIHEICMAVTAMGKGKWQYDPSKGLLLFPFRKGPCIYCFRDSANVFKIRSNKCKSHAFWCCLNACSLTVLGAVNMKNLNKHKINILTYFFIYYAKLFILQKEARDDNILDERWYKCEFLMCRLSPPALLSLHRLSLGHTIKWRTTVA